MYLGLDIGTSSVKAVLVDEHQVVVDEASAALSVQRPHPNWSEQNPEDWWTAVQAAVMSLNAAKRSGVKAIGLSGQMHGACCLDETLNVIRPAILWNDGRSAAECSQMTQALPSLTEISGNLAMPGFTAPKLTWMQKHEPELHARIHKVLLPKDYVRLRMSGDCASDMSDSAGTLWMDVKARSWSDALLGLSGLSQDHMPSLYEGSEATGSLRREVAASWGMDIVPIAAGGGDNASGAVGAGVVSKGEGFLSLGTSGVIFLCDDRFAPNTDGAVHTFCHALPNMWHQMSVMLSAASAIDYVAKITGFKTPADLYNSVETRAKPQNALTQNALTQKQSQAQAQSLSEFAPNDLLFLPYLSGERTPHNDPNAKGAFFGMTHDTDKDALARAALEGVAFGLADGLYALRKGGAVVDSLSVIGGGSRSAYWGRILSAALGVTLHYRDAAAVGPAFGAARLARLAHSSETPAQLCSPPPIKFSITPDRDLSDHFSHKRERFQRVYHAVKDL